MTQNAQLRLDEARKDIADILRKKKSGNGRKRTKYVAIDSDSDSTSSLDDIPVVKRAKKRTKSTKRKKYNMLKKVKNGK